MTLVATGCMLSVMTEIHLDNRGLQPPEPMVRILDAIAELPRGGRLVVLMDREPLLLYPELERRGYEWTFDEGTDSVLTVFHAAQP